ncbi:MAG: aminotransferase class V-fold PLP-dependent enzyme [bacterium]|nr:aminotransferase class V-fold PLP-dependent enzyme [bacterium]MDY4101096.1 aminotransferase class V-fold PLP-dependent enzyme [Lachnospiraceae bacterium]
MIYLNSAATSYPKPACVVEAYTKSINALPSAQFRSAGIFDNSDLFMQTRERLGKIFGIRQTENIYFTSGSTEALNRIVFGLPYQADEYMTTATEHNSVLRPLFNLTEGIEPVVVPCDENGQVFVGQMEKHLTDRTKVLIVNHCSNVTGAIQDLRAMGSFARAHGLLFIVDCSQSAGCIEILADEWGIDALAFTGHKSLLGVQGTGGYYIRDGIVLKPLLYGGSGKDSTRIRYDSDNYEYEVGTQNSNGIAALNQAAAYILEQGVNRIHEQEQKLAKYLISGLSKLSHVKVYGKDLSDRGPVVSISIDQLLPSDVAYILQSNYNMITRAGMQCAPLIHACIGSGKNGTLRISFSNETTIEELQCVIEAVKEIACAANG